MPVCVTVCMCVRMHVLTRMRACDGAHVLVCVCMSVCMCVCACARGCAFADAGVRAGERTCVRACEGVMYGAP